MTDINIKENPPLSINANLPLKIYFFQVLIKDEMNNVVRGSVESVTSYSFEDARAMVEQKFPGNRKEVIQVAMVNLQTIVDQHVNKMMPKAPPPYKEVGYVINDILKKGSGATDDNIKNVGLIPPRETGIKNYLCNLKMLKDKFSKALNSEDKIKLNQIIKKVELYVESRDKKKL